MNKHQAYVYENQEYIAKTIATLEDYDEFLFGDRLSMHQAPNISSSPHLEAREPINFGSKEHY